MFRVSTLLRRNILQRIFELPGAQSMKESPGDAISRFRDDVDENVESFSWTVDMVGLTLFSVVAIWMLVSIDGWFTLAVFGPTVVIVYIAAAARRRVKRYREATREATGRVTEALGETFGAVQAIKVAGAEGSMIKHFRRLSDERRARRGQGQGARVDAGVAVLEHDQCRYRDHPRGRRQRDAVR